MYKVYVIRSHVDKRLYVGFSSNVSERIKFHNSGHVFSTKGWRPWDLVYTEDVADRKTAREREKYLKSGVEKEFLKSRLNNIPG